jgi:hypothetical protein
MTGLCNVCLAEPTPTITPLPIIHPYTTGYQYDLPTRSTISVGVYTADNKLIRTLRRRGTEGPCTGCFHLWDGEDESGTPVQPGVPYTIKLIAYDVQYVWDGLVGNTSTSLSGPSHHAGQGFIQSLVVDGTNAFYAMGEQEGFPPVRRFNTGSPQTATTVMVPNARVNFDHVATDGTRLYIANKGASFSLAHPSFVAATNVADNSFAYFTNGVPISSNPGEPVYPSCIDVAPSPHPNSGNPTGLAVQRNGIVLAVSHGGQNKILLFHKIDGNQIGTIDVPNPGELAMTASGDLWVVSGTTVKRYTNLTAVPSLATNLTALWAPAAIATDGETLIAADGAPQQTIKAFSANGSQLWTFPNVSGGYATRGPEVTNDKFQFQVGNRGTPLLRTALASAAGSIWVGDGATNRLLRLNAGDRSYQDQIMFLTHNLGAVANPKAPTQLIGDGWLEFQVDYTKPLQNGGWSLKKNWAAGIPNNFFGGLDEGIQEVTTLSNGRVYGTIADYAGNPRKKTVVELPATPGSNLRICKDLAGNNLVLANEPTASAYGYGPYLSQAPSFESDGSQRFVRIANGRVTWYQKSLTGFDPSGNPQWAPETMIASAPYVNEDPVVFNEAALRQTRHPMTSSYVLLTLDDTFHLSGPYAKTTFPTAGATIGSGSPGWRHLGGIGLGRNDWSWKESGSVLTAQFGSVGRYDLGYFDIGDNLNYAASLVMAQGRNVVYGYFGENWKNTEASQWMHFYDNGLFIGQFGTPGNYRNHFGEALPGFTGNAFFPTMVGVNVAGPTANTQSTTGENYLWADDKSLHSGVARWHLVGANNVREFSGTGPAGSTIIVAPPPPIAPIGLTAVAGNQQVTLTWQALSGAPVYDVKYSTTNGGPYTTVASSPTTSYTVTGLANGVKYYFVVSTAGSPSNSNQVNAFPYNQVGIAGHFKGGPSDPFYFNSSPYADYSLINLPAVLGDLSRTDTGRYGYVLYNWSDGGAGSIGSSPVPFTTESQLEVTVNLVPGPWINDPQYVQNRFQGETTLPGRGWVTILGHDAAIDLPANSTGSLNIISTDTTYEPIHHLTVISPAYFDRPRDFTIGIAPQGQSPTAASSYTVNESVGDNHVFQFIFRGNITLSITNRLDTGACLQGLFID